jgi:hypothetical protein
MGIANTSQPAVKVICGNSVDADADADACRNRLPLMFGRAILQ